MQRRTETFLGSFLLNIWISYAIAYRPDVIAIEAALIIAFSSMIQAAAGGDFIAQADRLSGVL